MLGTIILSRGVGRSGWHQTLAQVFDCTVAAHEPGRTRSHQRSNTCASLLLARAARHLRTEVDTGHRRLGRMIDILLADIEGVKEHASYEHDKVRYLQQSIMTSLDVKQNQIVKVFTIITAVFLPPTLIATFYGMNFTVMPELAWDHGFLVTTLLTFVAALPLWYIKRKGWLR
jgi:magnesium transporter